MATETLKKAQERYWGEMAKLPALDAIFRACEALEADDQPVNRETVRERSSVTYTNLLATGIKLYKSRQAELEQTPHTPMAVLQVLARAVEQEFAQLSDHFDNRWQEQCTQYQAITEALKQDLTAGEATATEQAHALQEKEAQLEQEIEAVHELQEALAAAEQATEIERSRYRDSLAEIRELEERLTAERNHLSALVKEHEATLNTLKAEHQTHRQDLIGQHDQETARLQTQLGNERGEWQQQRQALESSVRQLQAEKSALKDQLLEAKHQGYQEREGREQDRLRYEERVSHIDAKAEGLEAQLRQSRAELNEKTGTIEQLRAELATARDASLQQTQTQMAELLERMRKLDLASVGEGAKKPEKSGKS